MAARLRQQLELIPTALRAVRCFADWPEPVLAKMTSAAELWRYRKGEAVAERGDPPKGLWIVAAGSFTAHRSAPNGTYYLQGVLWPGYMFGLMPALDGIVMPLSHAARCDSLVVLVPLSALGDVLNDVRYLRDLCLSMCRGSRVDYENLFSFGVDSLACRVAKMLAYLQRRAVFPVDAPPGSPAWIDPAPIDLTQDELASMTGVARQTLNRALQTFVQEGVVVRDGDAIKVANFKKLLAHMEETEPLHEIWRNEILSWDERVSAACG
ncbi:MAG TPA: Crp/Fnr family transcriptional regulator [Rhizomicrobium sp.]|nr:Crp/Fnr family transcriptional regulator [Rhizomicrobium sp.]